jgi:hypothetical protein
VGFTYWQLAGHGRNRLGRPGVQQLIHEGRERAQSSSGHGVSYLWQRVVHVRQDCRRAVQQMFGVNVGLLYLQRGGTKGGAGKRSSARGPIFPSHESHSFAFCGKASLFDDSVE